MSLKRMSQLVDGIIRYEKLTSVEKIERVAHDLSEIAREAVANLAAAAARKSHRLVMELSSLPAVVWGDKLLLLDAAVNVISNAIKYTPPRRPDHRPHGGGGGRVGPRDRGHRPWHCPGKS